MVVISIIITIIAFVFLIVVIVAAIRIIYNALFGLFEIWSGKAKGGNCSSHTYPWEDDRKNINITINTKSSNSH